jgi:hypothetical protein
MISLPELRRVFAGCGAEGRPDVTLTASTHWPGWEAEVASCRLDFGIHTLPPAWTSNGKDLSRVSRKAVPMTEIVDLNFEFARKLDGRSD